MILERKTRTTPASQDPFILGEVRRLLWLAAAAYTLLALVSYSVGDPSWSTWTTQTRFYNWMGRTGSLLADALFQALGLGAFALVALFTAAGLRRPRAERRSRLAPITSLLSLCLGLQVALPLDWVPWKLPHPGGLLGRALADTFGYATGPHGTLFIALVGGLLSGVLLWRISVIHSTLQATQWVGQRVASWVRTLGQWRPTWPRRRQAIAIAPANTTIATPHSAPVPSTEPILPLAPAEKDAEMNSLAMVKSPARRPSSWIPDRKSGPFTMPSLGMLSGRADNKMKTVDRNWYLEKSQILVEKLRDFGVQGEVVNISPGPVITVYEFKPASGVKIKEIANLSDDLTLALSVLSVRIVAPIPGKPVVGIEIPSPHREIVYFKDIVQETPFYSAETKLPLVLGRLASGEPAIAGLAAMPHLLVAGSTGTGKSVFINTLICSLLFRYSPRQLKLILVDPKMVELATYEGIPHLLLPVVVDSRKAALALRWTVDEMERRYTLMHQSGVRHVDAYNQKLEEAGETQDSPFLPYIVVVIDEYADLMAVVPKDVELSIARLAQKARASGIHLVLATQRPSTDVVTGTIKANFPSRVSFRVASSVDSKTILDRTGADRLLGNGDMLFHSAGFTTLKRIQGAYMSDSDLEQVVEHLRAQGKPEYDERLLRAQEEGDSSSDADSSGDGAELYDRAVRLVSEKGEASISLIQRHLKIGYNRAATLMDELEKQGVVAASAGSSKRRAVLVSEL